MNKTTKQPEPERGLIKAAVELPEIVLTQSYLDRRDGLVKAIMALPPITDLESEQRVLPLCQNLKKLIKEAENDEGELRAPVNAWMKKLRDTLNEWAMGARKLVAIREDQDAAYLDMERMRVEEAERKQKEAEEAAAAELERKRQEAERLAANVKGPKTLDKAIVAENEVKAAEQTMMATLSAPAPVMERASGSSFKREVEITVTDLHALYAYDRNLVNLTENRAALKARFKEPVNGVPGVTMRWKPKSSFRS